MKWVAKITVSVILFWKHITERYVLVGAIHITCCLIMWVTCIVKAVILHATGLVGSEWLIHSSCCFNWIDTACGHLKAAESAELGIASFFEKAVLRLIWIEKVWIITVLVSTCTERVHAAAILLVLIGSTSVQTVEGHCISITVLATTIASSTNITKAQKTLNIKLISTAIVLMSTYSGGRVSIELPRHLLHQRMYHVDICDLWVIKIVLNLIQVLLGQTLIWLVFRWLCCILTWTSSSGTCCRLAGRLRWLSSVSPWSWWSITRLGIRCLGVIEHAFLAAIHAETI